MSNRIVVAGITSEEASDPGTSMDPSGTVPRDDQMDETSGHSDGLDEIAQLDSDLDRNV